MESLAFLLNLDGPVRMESLLAFNLLGMISGSLTFSYGDCPSELREMFLKGGELWSITQMLLDRAPSLVTLSEGFLALRCLELAFFYDFR